MVKCFMTGIEVELEKAWLLDRGAAARAALNLKQRLAVVERLIAQLGPLEQAELFDYKSRTQKMRNQRRLVCNTVARALAASYPESPIFITWKDFAARKPRPQPKAAPPKPAVTKPPATVSGSTQVAVHANPQ